jgi:hypothetical protein
MPSPMALSEATLLFLRQQLDRYTHRQKFSVYRKELEGLLAEVEIAREEHEGLTTAIDAGEYAIGPESRAYPAWRSYAAFLKGEEVPSG